MSIFDRMTNDQAVDLLLRFSDQDYDNQARRLFEQRAPLSVGRGEEWADCPDDLAEQIYSLPIERAVDVAKGVHLNDGRLVRFRL